MMTNREKKPAKGKKIGNVVVSDKVSLKQINS